MGVSGEALQGQQFQRKPWEMVIFQDTDWKGEAFLAALQLHNTGFLLAEYQLHHYEWTCAQSPTD